MRSYLLLCMLIAQQFELPRELHRSLWCMGWKQFCQLKWKFLPFGSLKKYSWKKPNGLMLVMSN
ncbi:Uncharacterized protein TCM_019102 [Theobroma cacao]|uniref:Uncharacterized protein n=1 Tax=Theobroma cacao TaxID=3641 RepID=A0A061EG76_THECC|nr:Uncharacterized protein TCM_019102 [Theobroma cacao]